MGFFVRLAVVSLAYSAFACSSDDGSGGEPIDCSWLQAPNCWKESVDAAYACSNDSQGTFDAARSQCTAADVNITFVQPVPTDLFGADDFHWNFTLSRGGTQCARVIETDGGMELDTPAGHFSESVSGNDIVLQCPDGSRYAMNALQALGCGFDALPGFGYLQTDGLQFDLLGATKSDDVSLFTCGSP